MLRKFDLIINFSPTYLVTLFICYAPLDIVGIWTNYFLKGKGGEIVRKNPIEQMFRNNKNEKKKLSESESMGIYLYCKDPSILWAVNYISFFLQKQHLRKRVGSKCRIQSPELWKKIVPKLLWPFYCFACLGSS